MKTIDIYTTPQCGFCQKLKQILKEKNIPNVQINDVIESENLLEEIKGFTNGILSVPVTVVDKGLITQKIAIGYPDSLDLLGLEKQTNSAFMEETAFLTCPLCGYQQEGVIPTTACVPFYVCHIIVKKQLRRLEKIVVCFVRM